MSANPAQASPAFVRPAGVALDSPVGTAINGLYLAEERECIAGLLPLAKLDPEVRAQVQELAIELIDAVRRNRTRKGGLDAFLKQYDLASREGVILMCLAEALLRIPDAETADRLIADKIAAGNWSEHLGDSDSLFVNASTWGLMLTGRLFRPEADELANPAAVIARMATRLGEPVVRAALKQAMRIMGHQFVMGRTMQEALRASARRGQPPVSLFLRHARRGCDDGRGCSTVQRGLFAGHCYRWRASGRFDVRRGGTQHLGQAVCAFPSLRVRTTRACARGARTAAAATRGRSAQRANRADHRC